MRETGSNVRRGPSGRRWPVWLGLALLAAGCRTLPVTDDDLAGQKPASVPLRVRVAVFDAPSDDPVARACARLAAVDLADRIATTNDWWTATVVPDTNTLSDLLFHGSLAAPDPGRLELHLTALDSSGRVRLKRTFQAPRLGPLLEAAGTEARLLIDGLARKHGSRRLMEISDLRFAADLAPERFSGYLQTARDGTRTALRLPAADDPLWLRSQRIRERDTALHKAVHSQFEVFALAAAPALTSYFDHVQAEIRKRKELEKQNRLRPLRLLVGGFISGIGVFAESIGEAFGGKDEASQWLYDRGDTMAVGKDRELAENRDALAATGKLLEAEMSPFVSDLDGRQIRLTGSASMQIQKFREILRDLHREETGLTPP